MSVAAQAPHAESRGVRSRIQALLLCEPAVALAGDLRERHERILRTLVEQHRGLEIDRHDGALILFERPLNAVAFALDYQRGMRELATADGTPATARVGVHVGEVVLWENSASDVADGAKQLEIEGHAKAVASRLMRLALPGQTLLSDTACTLAQRARHELDHRGTQVIWRPHGRYHFKGSEQPQPVHEVGERGIAALRAPPGGPKARRLVPAWRRPWLQVAVVTLLLVVVPLTLMLRPKPAIAFVERDWVVLATLRNLTDVKLFDGSLDAALRIGLEQSAHVNVVSQLKLGEALQRMQRAPATTIDRELATELALREGAKAVLLPTVAEVGGRARLSLEVIDPNTGVSVYTHTAEAATGSDMIGAMDSIVAGLRRTLGESVSSIERRSMPLEQATTPDLEALRAFSLATHARIEGRFGDSVALLQEAIRRDPGFAVAHLTLAGTLITTGAVEAAQQALDAAAAHPERLTQREQLVLHATRATLHAPDEALRHWSTLAALYPDEYRAHYNFAFYATFDAQRYDDAVRAIEPALASQNAARAAAHQLRGRALLAADRIDEALGAFDIADSWGPRPFRRDIADAHAARRDFGAARAVIAAQRHSGMAGHALLEQRGEVTWLFDEGRWDEGADRLQALAELLPGAPARVARAHELMALSAHAYATDDAGAGVLAAFIHGRAADYATGDIWERRHLGFQLLAAGWLALRAGRDDVARQAWQLAGEDALASAFPATADMARVLAAELALADGHPDRAIERLQSRAGAGDELYFVHVPMVRAQLLRGDPVAALAHADWLATHRGRAYGEANSLNAWNIANVLESTLALMVGAELAARIGDDEGARRRRAAFDAAWPTGIDAPLPARRRQQLQADLDVSSSTGT